MRLEATLISIRQWIKLGVDKIVFCDGSGFNIYPYINDELISNNIDFESIYFLNDIDCVKKLGKGYGEGEIIKYALQNSDLIKKYPTFAKCTSKLWAINFSDIWPKYNGQFQANFDGLFRPKTVDTRFYIINKEFYIKTFINSYNQVNDKDGNYLEVVFLSEIKLLSLIDWVSVPHIRIAGLSGSTSKFTHTSIVKSWLKSRRNEILLLF